MKRKINAEQFEALSEEMQALYALKGDFYVLTLEDDDDDDDKENELEAARNKRKIEAEHRKKAETKARELEKELKELREARLNEDDEAARNKGDIDALDKSWGKKLSVREAELQAEIDQHKSAVQHLLVDGKANEIAARLSEVPELLAPVIKQRLRVEYIDGKPETRVIDSEGKLSASTLEDLEKEIAGDKRFAPVIIASKGSGGGSRGDQQRPGGAKKFSELSEQERIDWHRKDPDGFQKASQEAND